MRVNSELIYSMCVSSCSFPLRIPNEEAERGVMAADAEGQSGGQSTHSLYCSVHKTP